MKTKTKMRLLSLLLCFVMLVGLLPTAAFAAEKVIIDSISATVTLPTAGAHPVETGTPGDSSYDIIRIRFSKKDADSGVLTSLEPSDTFEAGATYRINVLFRAKNGFTIEREAKATINGMEAEYWSTIADGYGSQYFGLEYTVPEKITSISVTVPEPVAGEKADTNGITINPAALSVSSAKWYINKDGVGLVSVDKFTAGKTYYLVIKYDVAEGYTVSNSAAISHDLTDGEIAHNSSNKTIMIEYTVAVQAPITYTVSFDANGGSGTMADVTGISGEYTLPACTFTPPAGKQFKCWRVDGSEKMAGDKINVAEDMVVYAVWKDTVYDRTEISTVVAESDGGNITPVYGTATDDNPVFTVTTGSPAYCSTVMCGWRKHDGEHYVDCEETFAADTYYYYMQVRIDGASGTTHKLDDPNLRVIVDGTEWIVHSVYVFDDVSWANVYSPAFVVTKDSATTISELSATVTEPVAGYAPSLAAVAGGAGYTVEYVEWVDTAEETVLYPEDGDTFEAGKQYTVFVEFEPKDGYVFAEDASVVINEQPAEDKEVKETFAYGAITFTLAEPYLIESVKLSDVTEPSVGATPDFDITLTGETAVLSEGGEPSIFWYKYDPETDGWDDMDASTTFGAGTYMLEVWMKAEAGHKFTEGTKLFYGDEELPEFDGRMEHNYELAGEDYAGIYLYFTVDEVVRLFGASRYETGYAVADALKEVLGVEKFEAVVVATGKNFADALAGSYLAVEKNAPILLTNGKDDNIAQLHTYIKENVTEGGKVYILGGEAAVPTAVEAMEEYDVVRLFGESRYDTNLAILAEAGVTGDSIIVATGKNFADSLSASAAKLPILLVKPNAALNDAQKEILAGMKNIYIVGGEGAVSEAYAAELAAYGEVTRVFGDSRYDTSVEVAKTFFGDVDKAVVASGKNFPDGLCGGPLAAALNAPLVLTLDGKTAAAVGYVADNGIEAGYVLGGDGALSNDAVVTVFGLESADEIK